MYILETLPAEPGSRCYWCSIPGFGPRGQPVPLAVVKRYLPGDDQPLYLCEGCRQAHNAQLQRQAQVGHESCVICDNPFTPAGERLECEAARRRTS